MPTQARPMVQPTDLANCDREPIHIPGRIQPHGMLLALSGPALRISHISENCRLFLGKSASACLDQDLATALGEENAAAVKTRLASQSPGADGIYLLTLQLSDNDRRVHVVAHRHEGVTLLELEPAGAQDTLTFQGVHARIRAAIGELQRMASPQGVCEVVAEQVRQATGFDRVMIYRFDADWNGQVIAESRAPDIGSYAGHYFPASDIPRQARELYRLNRLRIIPDVHYAPAALVSSPQSAAKPLDLSFSILRSVSPIHLEYLRNMEVGASMSISIVKQEKLWGLIACHHRSALFVPYEVRTACDFLGQVAALQLGFTEYSAGQEYRLELNSRQAKLLAYMSARDDFTASLIEHESDLLGLVDAEGAALVAGDAVHCVGKTPPLSAFAGLMRWLAEKHPATVYHTDRLSVEYPPAEDFRENASGLLALSLPRSRSASGYVLWFRPEAVRTITWAGDPTKPVTDATGSPALHPRRSFASWMQVVRLRSRPWRDEEIEAAAGLRESIIAIVLRKAEELAQLNADLERSNKELEAFSYSVSHDLRAPFRHIVGYSNLLQKHAGEKLDATSRRYLSTIEESARYAGTLVDSLLAFSQMGRISLRRVPVDMNIMFISNRNEVASSEAAGRAIEWKIDPMPTVSADPAMLRLAVRNLISNAVKYTRPREAARIHVGYRLENNEHLFSIEDNGVGFDMAYVDKLFGVFQRLHRVEEFEGTGIGLANVRRIIDRHGGRVWADAKLDVGATFFFTLPTDQPQSTEQ